MNPIDLLRGGGRRLAVITSTFDTEDGARSVSIVYALRRVGSAAFLRMSLSTLASVRAGSEDDDEMQSRLRGACTDEDRARIESEMAAAKEKRTAELMGELLKSPAGVEDLMARMDELIQSSVVASGIALEGTPDGLLPEGTKAVDVVEVQEDGATLRPIKWSPAPADENLCIRDLPEQIRITLAGLIREAFAPSDREVTSFPGRSGDPSSRVPVGEGLQPEAGRAPDRRGKGSKRAGARGGARSRGNGGGG